MFLCFQFYCLWKFWRPGLQTLQNIFFFFFFQFLPLFSIHVALFSFKVFCSFFLVHCMLGVFPSVWSLLNGDIPALSSVVFLTHRIKLWLWLLLILKGFKLFVLYTVFQLQYCLAISPSQMSFRTRPSDVTIFSRILVFIDYFITIFSCFLIKLGTFTVILATTRICFLEGAIPALVSVLISVTLARILTNIESIMLLTVHFLLLGLVTRRVQCNNHRLQHILCIYIPCSGTYDHQYLVFQHLSQP